MMHTVTLAEGDGIGPEITEVTVNILQEAGARVEFEKITVGEKLYRQGNTSGISATSWDLITKNRVLLKAPITTPQGGGYKSLNVTLRKSLGLFANIRPTRSYAPFVACSFPGMDLVIIRENEEDLYAGIEHQQTDEVIQCLKLVSVPGCERIIRYAFEYARQNNRGKVTCMTKDNIMKQTDGLFHRLFDEIGKEYPDLQKEHWIIDIGAALIATAPERFDVIVTLNLYGDILSDIASQVSGSVGLAGSANIGERSAMFEPVHGSAPDLAGRNIANPSGMINAAVMMLNHLGETETASVVQNAWLRTIEDGIHTADLCHSAHTAECVSTTEFGKALIQRMGMQPRKLKGGECKQSIIRIPGYQPQPPAEKELVGIDIFLRDAQTDPERLGAALSALKGALLEPVMISNRGTKVWPNGIGQTFCTDHWRCRFLRIEGNRITQDNLLQLQQQLHGAGFTIIKTENLYHFNNRPAFSLGQGQ